MSEELCCVCDSFRQAKPVSEWCMVKYDDSHHSVLVKRCNCGGWQDGSSTPLLPNRGRIASTVAAAHRGAVSHDARHGTSGPPVPASNPRQSRCGTCPLSCNSPRCQKKCVVCAIRSGRQNPSQSGAWSNMTIVIMQPQRFDCLTWAKCQENSTLHPSPHCTVRVAQHRKLAVPGFTSESRAACVATSSSWVSLWSSAESHTDIDKTLEEKPAIIFRTLTYSLLVTSLRARLRLEMRR